jgi:hypothetical protein
MFWLGGWKDGEFIMLLMLKVTKEVLTSTELSKLARMVELETVQMAQLAKERFISGGKVRLSWLMSELEVRKLEGWLKVKV